MVPRAYATSSTPGQSGVFGAPPRIPHLVNKESGAALEDSLYPGVEGREERVNRDVLVQVAAGCSVTRRMAASRRPKSTGLVRCSAKPASSLRRRSSSMP